MMRGLVVDYVGVLDGNEEERRRWASFLTALKRTGVPVAILSNDPGGPAAEQIREWKYRGLVDAVNLSGEIGAEKPSELAFEIAAQSIDREINECVMVDDSILNIRAAVDCGMVGVFYQQFDRSIVELNTLFGMGGEY